MPVGTEDTQDGCHRTGLVGETTYRNVGDPAVHVPELLRFDQAHP